VNRDPGLLYRNTRESRFLCHFYRDFSLGSVPVQSRFPVESDWAPRARAGDVPVCLPTARQAYSATLPACLPLDNLFLSTPRYLDLDNLFLSTTRQAGKLSQNCDNYP